jgi:hypothetical protein
MSVASGRQEELDHRRDEAIARAIAEWNDSGQRADLAVLVAEQLEAYSADYCVVCHYKRKARAGDVRPFGHEPGHLTPLAEIVKLPKGASMVDLPESGAIYVKVLTELRLAGDHGLTDSELSERAEIYKDTCKAARNALMGHGWVKASGVTRPSPRLRPMNVWLLTDAARDALAHRAPEASIALSSDGEGVPTLFPLAS